MWKKLQQALHIYFFLDNVDNLRNTSYKFLYESYLIRGLPVTVEDTLYNIPHKSTGRRNTFWHRSNFTEQLLRLRSIIRQEPCSVQTNLIMSRLITVEELFHLLLNLKNEKPYFAQMHNCDFDTVKETRLLTDRPYFYPRFLEPPFSSWILLSSNYASGFKKLSLRGIVIVTQLRENLVVKLKAKTICYQSCGEYEFVLYFGQSLVFYSDLWDFSYQPFNGLNFSITFITETNLK